MKNKIETPDQSTEEKIKEAARIVFTRKGFAATRTRDIAEEAGYKPGSVELLFQEQGETIRIGHDGEDAEVFRIHWPNHL